MPLWPPTGSPSIGRGAQLHALDRMCLPGCADGPFFCLRSTKSPPPPPVPPSPFPGIRVNAVAPGPIWTPLIPATFPRTAMLGWQKQVPMGRAGQPSEVSNARSMAASRPAAACCGYSTFEP